MLSPRFLNVIEKLKEEEGWVIVEGKKDSTALKLLGLKNIISISGKSLEEVVEKTISLNPSYVTILTDFDKEGESIASRLSTLFSLHKIKVDQVFRNKFKTLKIHQIEELNSFKKLMEDGQNGKISSIYYKIFNRSRILSRRNSGKTGCDRSNIWSNRRSFGSRPGLKRTPKDW
jgi:5S rRNA maturation endonuclease (ribonuclease M5)